MTNTFLVFLGGHINEKTRQKNKCLENLVAEVCGVKFHIIHNCVWGGETGRVCMYTMRERERETMQVHHKKWTTNLNVKLVYQSLKFLSIKLVTEPQTVIRKINGIPRNESHQISEFLSRVTP